MMAQEYKGFKGRGEAAAPAEQYGPITEGADFPVGTARFLLVGTAGTATLVREDGTEVADVPLQAGVNPLVCKQVKTLGTAAAVFWCL